MSYKREWIAARRDPHPQMPPVAQGNPVLVEPEDAFHTAHMVLLDEQAVHPYTCVEGAQDAGVEALSLVVVPHP